MDDQEIKTIKVHEFYGTGIIAGHINVKTCVICGQVIYVGKNSPPADRVVCDKHSPEETEWAKALHAR